MCSVQTKSAELPSLRVWPLSSVGRQLFLRCFWKMSRQQVVFTFTSKLFFKSLFAIQNKLKYVVGDRKTGSTDPFGHWTLRQMLFSIARLMSDSGRWLKNMSALLSRNGQILAMCCLIVSSVFPSVRSRYHFQTEGSDMVHIIILNGQYGFIATIRSHPIVMLATMSSTDHVEERNNVFWSVQKSSYNCFWKRKNIFYSWLNCCMLLKLTHFVFHGITDLSTHACFVN